LVHAINHENLNGRAIGVQLQAELLAKGGERRRFGSSDRGLRVERGEETRAQVRFGPIFGAFTPEASAWGLMRYSTRARRPEHNTG